MRLDAFIPHGFCLAWDPGLVWLQAASDLLIALAYFSIPAALVVFLRRRRDLAFRWVFALFAAFILACGTTHVLGIVTLFAPIYWVDGIIKAITAALSIATAIMLWPLLPKALALPSPSDLAIVNAKLAQEIAERDATATRLIASERQVRQLYDRSPAILHATDPHGVLLEVSQRWLDLFGFERHEVIGRCMNSFYAPGTVALAEDACDDRAAGWQILLRNGEIRDVEPTCTMERDTEGELQRVLVALSDVTLRKQTETALRESEERLRHAQKMEAVGQLTGGIAHDFNNLLTTVLASLEMLGRQEALDARGRRMVGNALEGARRAARLTSQLLSFSRRSRLTPERLEPHAVICGVSELLRQSGGGGIALTIEAPVPAPWPIMADRSQLEAAILNLVINARDAIKGDGSIAIAFANHTLSAAEGAAIRPDPVPGGQYVGIRVSDTGSGMTPDVLTRALEPFFTTKAEGAGTGLGLSQTYGFAVQSGGTLRIDTAPGSGTTIEIVLPADLSTERVCLQNGPAPPMTKAAQGTIVIADDDALLRHTVSEMLRGEGFTVEAACDGASALALLQRLPAADLLLTDVMMPGGMNGVQLARRARAMFPDLPIIFASGYTEKHTLSEWPETLDVVNKPFSSDELIRKIISRLPELPGGMIKDAEEPARAM